MGKRGEHFPPHCRPAEDQQCFQRQPMLLGQGTEQGLPAQHHKQRLRRATLAVGLGPSCQLGHGHS